MILQKYTLQSNGVWERIRALFAVDANRSNGIPLNPQYRNPPPGANPPEAYDDPVTVPAGDIAQNQYFNRDSRRAYPRLSVVKQADVVGLLTVGSKAKPNEEALQIGDAGTKQLADLKTVGEDTGLAAFFAQKKEAGVSVLGPGGLPPLPGGLYREANDGIKKYTLDVDRTEGFPPE